MFFRGMLTTGKEAVRGRTVPALLLETNRRTVVGARNPGFQLAEMLITGELFLCLPPPREGVRISQQGQKIVLFFRSQSYECQFVSLHGFGIQIGKRSQKLMLGGRRFRRQ